MQKQSVKNGSAFCLEKVWLLSWCVMCMQQLVRQVPVRLAEELRIELYNFRVFMRFSDWLASVDFIDCIDALCFDF